jgi:hypothetical protein
MSESSKEEEEKREKKFLEEFFINKAMVNFCRQKTGTRTEFNFRLFVKKSLF